MAKVCRWRFLSFSETAEVTQKWSSFLFCKFHWVLRHVGGRPWIIKKNVRYLSTFFSFYKMPKVCRRSFLSLFDTAHVTQKLKIFLFWKFHWVWRDVGRRLQIIRIMTDIKKICFASSQCQECVDAALWVSLALLKWLRNYKLLYLASFTDIDVISEEYTKLWRKRRISW